MRTNYSFAVMFFLRRGRSKAKEIPLYVRITVNSQRIEFSLNRKVDESIWNSKKSMVAGRSPYCLNLNNYIKKVRTEITDAYESLLLEGEIITPQSVKLRFLNLDEDRPTLLKLVTYHYKLAENEISPGTLKNYRTTERYIKLFLKKSYKVEDMLLSKLSFSFLTRFENFLRMHEPTDHQKKMTNNTVMKHIQRLRKIIGLAVRLEWIDKDPFANFKTKFIRKDRGYLNDYELKAIEDKEFSMPRLQLVKDLFVFSCYTGLAYIDVMQLNKDNISTGIDGHKWIITARKKTGKGVHVPLLPKAEELLLKYQDNIKALHNGTCFPKISNQKLNAYLKEIADLCEIKKHITFHLARHTFATTVTLANDVPLSTVSKMLGHSKITTTQIYARVLEQKVSYDMAALREKLDSKELKVKRLFQKTGTVSF